MTTLTWTAAHPRPAVPCPGSARTTCTTAPTMVDPVRWTSLEYGRVRLDGAEKQVEQHVFAKFSADQINAQVKDTGIRMPLGPPLWRPPE